MSRAIKFRAWRSKSKVMSPAATLLEWLGLGRSHGELADADDVDFMQFTGLQDKNGADIYEGDIIKSTNNKHYWLYVVGTSPNFGGMLWALMYENNLSTCDIVDVYTYEKQAVELGSRRDFINERMEVIGNIHQNPELLECE